MVALKYNPSPLVQEAVNTRACEIFLKVTLKYTNIDVTVCREMITAIETASKGARGADKLLRRSCFSLSSEALSINQSGRSH